MRISEDKGPTLKSDGVTLREIKALVDNMFKEILQSYINRERQYLEELAYLRSSTGGENGVGSYNSNNKSSSFAKQPTADFGGDDMVKKKKPPLV